MKVLLVGGGGREHALAWKLAGSPEVERVYVAPGNAGTALEPGVENVALDPLDFDALVSFAARERVALTVVGPEAPLVAGIADVFAERGLRCLGPGAAGARLEGSKAYAKDFLARHGIPTASYRAFDDPDAAEAWIRERGAPVVVKADGLAAGKGVTVARDEATAVATVRSMLGGDAFGDAGRRVVIETLLEGEEASFIVLADGERYVTFASSQDHKTRDDGDVGPNTGGMGAYTPAPVVTSEVHARICERVIEPTLRGLAADGTTYRGFLYAGLMIDPAGEPAVIEFNCRFGDPEAQPVLARLRSDLAVRCIEAADGRLGDACLEFDPRAALGVVMAAGGYPNAYRKGDTIEGLDAVDDDVRVFHAGTRRRGGRTVTDGGRVLCVVGLGEGVAAAAERAYAGVSRIRFADAVYRRDIGHRAIGREAASADTR